MQKAGTSPAMTIRTPKISRVAGFARQHPQINADLAQGLFILRVCILTENQFRVGRAVKPSVLLDLVLELSGGPSSVAKRKDSARRSFAPRNRLENVERSSKADALVDGQCGILNKEIGRV